VTRASDTIRPHAVAPEMRRARSAVALLVAAVVVGVLAGCGGLFYQGTRELYTRPEAAGYRWEPHLFPRPGGGVLSAARIPGRGPDSGRGLIVQFHGNAQNMTAHWLALRWAVLQGWDLVVWDYSGYGASDGEASRGQVARDADAFLAWVSDSILPDVRGPVVLVGQSLGSAILLSSFPRWKDRDRATLVLAEGAFASYRAMARDRVAQSPVTWIAWPLVPLLIDDEDAPTRALSRIPPTPLLVVSCLDDQVVPPRFQRDLHERAAGSLFWPVAGCPHIGAFRGDSVRVRFQSLIDSLLPRTEP